MLVFVNRYTNKTLLTVITILCCLWVYNPVFFPSDCGEDPNDLTGKSERSGAAAVRDYKRLVALPNPGARSIL